MRVPRLAAAALLAVALVVAPAAAASALPGDFAHMADPPPDFTPSSNKFREWMLNVTSKMLGGATPDKWRAEQLANQYRYNHSWEGLGAQFGTDPANPNYSGKPDSYQDYVLRKTEQDLKGGWNNKPFKAPATGVAKFAKPVGGVLTVIGAYSIGTMLGAAGTNIVGGAIGWDAQGQVCTSWGNDLTGTLVRMISGQSCDAYNFIGTYTLNGDAGVNYGDLTFGGSTIISYRGTVIKGSFGTSWENYCYYQPGGFIDNAYQLQSRSSTGAWVNVGTIDYEPQNACSGLSGASSLWYQYGKILTVASGTIDNSNRAVSPGVRLVRKSDSTVLGTMTEGRADPNRSIVCKVTMTDGTSVQASSDTYKESTGATAPTRCPATPPGKVPNKVTLTQKTDGQPDQTLYDEPTTPGFKQWAQDYPECGTGACKLDLHKVNGGTRVSCFSAALADGCPGWWEDPSKTSNYKCTYGTHDVDIEECAVYSGIFAPGRATTGAPYSDPTTGTWSGGQASPRDGETAMTRTIQDPSAFRSCDLSTIGFDPIGWVVKPLQCWSEWAAVPRPAVAEVAFAGVEEVWAGKPPGVIAEAVSTMSISANVGGCSVGTTWHGVSQNIVDACGGPMAGLAAFTRLASFAVMGVLVFAKVRRQIAGMVNYNVGQD